VSLERARGIAEAARQRRASLISALASGELALADVDDDDRASDVRVVVIAESVPGIGKVRARRALDALGVPPSTRWAELSQPQRRRLLEALTVDGGPPATAP
jgi:hypothetical protein